MLSTAVSAVLQISCPCCPSACRRLGLLCMPPCSCSSAPSARLPCPCSLPLNEMYVLIGRQSEAALQSSGLSSVAMRVLQAVTERPALAHSQQQGQVSLCVPLHGLGIWWHAAAARVDAVTGTCAMQYKLQCCACSSSRGIASLAKHEHALIWGFTSRLQLTAMGHQQSLCTAARPAPYPDRLLPNTWTSQWRLWCSLFTIRKEGPAGSLAKAADGRECSCHSSSSSGAPVCGKLILRGVQHAS